MKERRVTLATVSRQAMAVSMEALHSEGKVFEVLILPMPLRVRSISLSTSEGSASHRWLGLEPSTYSM